MAPFSRENLLEMFEALGLLGIHLYAKMICFLYSGEWYKPVANSNPLPHYVFLYRQLQFRYIYSYVIR